MEGSSTASSVYDASLPPTSAVSEFAPDQQQLMATIDSSATITVPAPLVSESIAPALGTTFWPQPYSISQLPVSISYAAPLPNAQYPFDAAPQYPPQSSTIDSEIEEIMKGVRVVSSSVISRAVRQARKGKYGYAIATLITAISLINQSKVASQLRGKVVIESLEHCLRGIEQKSFGSRTKKRKDGTHRRSYHPYKDQRSKSIESNSRKQDGIGDRVQSVRKDRQEANMERRSNHQSNSRHQSRQDRVDDRVQSYRKDRQVGNMVGRSNRQNNCRRHNRSERRMR